MYNTHNSCFEWKFGWKQHSIYFVTQAYLFSLDEVLCHIVSTRNNSCEFCAFDDVYFQNFYHSGMLQKFHHTCTCLYPPDQGHRLCGGSKAEASPPPEIILRGAEPLQKF